MTTKEKEGFEKKLARMRADQARLRKEIVLLRKENEKTQKALNQTEGLLKSLPAGFMVLDKTKIVEVNEFILSQLGYSIEDMVSRPFADFVHPRLKNITRDFQRRRASGKWAPEEYETDLVAKNGDVLGCDVKVRKVRRRGRSAFLLMLTPSEERKKKENDLAESRKRVSLRRMAREILRLVDPSGGEALSGIRAALESYAREALEASQKSVVDLKRVVREAVACVGPKLNGHTEEQGPEIKLKTYLRSVSPVEGDSAEIGEMLSQVMVNAVESMPHGGDLYLSIEEAAGQAHIYVQDSGAGIVPEILDKVFDPFFTTKEEGHPGLGLCVARSIARRHKGTLELSSKKNEGTVVSILLPLAPASPRKGRKKKKANEVSILLIEEDGMIRDLLYKLLDHKGYRVSAVTTEAEGLQQIERKPFDLVIVGSGTTAMKAHDLIKEIRKKKAGLKVALITAGERGEGRFGDRIPTVDMVIRKPIDMTSTLERLSKVLAG